MTKKEREYRPELSGDADYVAYKKSLARTDAERTDLSYGHVSQLFATLGLPDLLKVAKTDYLDTSVINGLIEEGFYHVQAAETKPVGLVEVWNWLAEEDTPRPVDAAFILGGGNTRGRAKKAADLYSQGLTTKVITTGRGPHYQKDDELALTEAEETAAELEALGVLSKDIVVEKQSTNTMENVIYARDILTSKGVLPASVALITVPYHMRRGSLTFKAAAGDWQPLVIRQVCDSQYTVDNWYQDLGSWKVILLEYVKLAQAQDMGHF